jgi:hypothetical protein
MNEMSSWSSGRITINNRQTTKYLKRPLSQYYFIYHKSNADCPENEPELQRYKACN